jgi:hypothetical protein
MYRNQNKYSFQLNVVSNPTQTFQIPLQTSSQAIWNSEQFSKENQILNSIMVEPDVKFVSCLFLCFKNDFKNNLKKFIFIFFFVSN